MLQSQLVQTVGNAVAERIEQWRGWLEAMTGGDEPPADPTPEQREQERRRQEAHGLATVVALFLEAGRGGWKRSNSRRRLAISGLA